MGDSVKTQILTQSRNLLVVKLDNISDGTGESAVTKVDVSGLTAVSPTGQVCTRVSLARVVFSTYGMGAQILWDATTPVLAMVIPPDGAGDITFDPPIPNDAGTGINGDIKLTTVGHSSGDAYSIILYLRKS